MVVQSGKTKMKPSRIAAYAILGGLGVLAIGIVLTHAVQTPHGESAEIPLGSSAEPAAHAPVDAPAPQHPAIEAPSETTVADSVRTEESTYVGTALDVPTRIRELRRQLMEQSARTFAENPEQGPALRLLEQCMLVILDASNDYVALPAEGVLSDSKTVPSVAAGERWMIQLIGDIENRKYKITEAMFPLYHEIEKLKPDGLFTGKPDLTPEQIQAVRALAQKAGYYPS